MFSVEFHETSDGKCPVVDFLDSLEPKMRAKMVSMMEIISGSQGNQNVGRRFDYGLYQWLNNNGYMT